MTRSPWYQSPTMALDRYVAMLGAARARSLPPRAWVAIGERLFAAADVVSGVRARRIRDLAIEAHLLAARAYSRSSVVIEVMS